MSLKRFAIEEWVGSLVFSSIPISGRDKLFKYLLVSNSVLLAAFSKIVLYEYCQTLLTFTCLIPPHSLDGKFSLSRPRLVAGPDRAGWLQDAVECTIRFLPRVYHNRIRAAMIGAAAGLTATLQHPAPTSHFTITIATILVQYWVPTPNYKIRSQHNKPLHKVIYSPFTHPSYCKSHGGGLMLQWAVITSGPSPVSVLSLAQVWL